MTDLSPMERAVRALVPALTDGTWTFTSPSGTSSGPHRRDEMVVSVIRRMGYLRTSDPDALATVLAECGVVTHSDGDAWAAMDDALDEALFRALGPTESRTGAVLKSLTTRGYHLVSEGQAVIEGRVVELECAANRTREGEQSGWVYWDNSYPVPRQQASKAENLYRVKPERSDRPLIETTPHAAWQALADEPLSEKHTEDAS